MRGNPVTVLLRSPGQRPGQLLNRAIRSAAERIDAARGGV